jgi:hypothetical protein
MNSPLDQDRQDRWVPTPQQMRVAAAMLAAEPAATHVLVGLALPGKREGWWTLGQPVEPAPGYFLAADTRRKDGTVPDYSQARDLADQAAGAQLAGRAGTSSYAVIHRDGYAGMFEGMYGNEESA